MTVNVDAPAYMTVLVPLDGSHVAAEALPHAVETSLSNGATIVLLHVLPAGAPTRERDAIRAQMQAYLDGLKRSLQRAGVKVAWLIEAGEPAEVIATVAQRLEKPIVVLSESGRTASGSNGASHEARGSVAESFSHLWHGPVVVVKHAA